MLFDEKCITKIIRILIERLQREYRIECQQQQSKLSRRLINLVTITDDEFQILCKAQTDWNCHERNQWNIIIEKIWKGKKQKTLDPHNEYMKKNWK